MSSTKEIRRSATAYRQPGIAAEHFFIWMIVTDAGETMITELAYEELKKIFPDLQRVERPAQAKAAEAGNDGK